MEKILILGLAAYRITRFLIEDTLLNRLRERLIGDPEKNGTLGLYGKLYARVSNRKARWWLLEFYTLITCAFCLSVWIAAILWNIYDRSTFIAGVLGWLAVAGVVAIIYDMRPDDTVDAIKDLKG